MKVLLISAYFPPDKGSAAVLYHELGRQMARLGHQVTVITTLPGYLAGGDLRRYRWKLWHRERIDVGERAGIDVIRVASPRLPRRFVPGRAIWQFGTALSVTLAGLLARRHDVALVYSPPLPLGFSAWCLARLGSTPYVLNVQDLFPKSVVDLGMLKNPVAIRFFQSLEGFLYARSDAIAVHSKGNADFVTGRGAPSDRVHVVENWVDTEAILADGDGSAFRERNGLSDSFVVSFAGVLGFSQDLDVVLAAAEILKDHSRICWVIVGDGVEKQRLERIARDRNLNNVRFMPMVPHEKYPEVLYGSEVGLATLKASVKTPVVPSKILSIMAAAKPVVACMDPSGDAIRLVREADCGIAVAPDDPRGLADAILRLYDDSGLRRCYGLNGRRYVEARHSLAVATEKFLGVFREVSARHGAAVA
ncbi:MAG: glycosyltransferase family 4 protein [Chloroflexi bacterium]|nr:glycosyltransferase family 4 protein [Chloroflexota bacterium]